MQGDLNVDLLMLPVLHAIERHVKDREAATEIYNRAYEAVMNSMDALDVSAKVTAKQIAENANNLQRAEAAEARAEAAEAETAALRSFIGKIMLLGLDSPRLRDEALKILDGQSECDVSMAEDVLTDIKTSNSAESDDCGKALSDALMKSVELRARLDVCEDALISMVRQFFYSAEGSNCFSHAFMSAEEEAAAYLVGNGIAFWNDVGHSQICFTEVDDAG